MAEGCSAIEDWSTFSFKLKVLQYYSHFPDGKPDSLS